MITHTAYLAFAAEHRARVAQAERFGHLHGDVPRRPRRSRRSGTERPWRRRSGAGRGTGS